MESMQAQVQVWLETSYAAGQVTVIPLARSMREAELSFRLTAASRGQAGSSQISQQGRLTLQAGRSQALARLNLGNLAGKTCTIEVAVRDDTGEEGNFRFDVTPE